MITSHHQADADSISSGIGMKFLLKSLFPNVHSTLVFTSINEVAKKMIDFYKIKYNSPEDLNNYDAFFLLDVNNISLLEENISIFETNKPAAFITLRALNSSVFVLILKM